MSAWTTVHVPFYLEGDKRAHEIIIVGEFHPGSPSRRTGHWSDPPDPPEPAETQLVGVRLVWKGKERQLVGALAENILDLDEVQRAFEEEGPEIARDYQDGAKADAAEAARELRRELEGELEGD
jgi:hypothetical protein